MDDVTTQRDRVLNLPIGHTLQGQLTADKARFKCPYLGMKRDEFLIAQMPGVPGFRDKIAQSPGLFIRFMLAGTIFGFETRVVSLAVRPYPLLFFAYPRKVETVNLRKTRRVDTFIEALSDMGEGVFPGAILDLSLGGCLFSMDRAKIIRAPLIVPGQVVTLQFSLDEPEIKLLLNAEIINSRMDMDTIQVGLKFLFTPGDKPLARKIVAYIDNIQGFLGGRDAL